MGVKLNYAVTGKLKIQLDGMRFGKQIQSPQQNVKHLGVQSTEINVHSTHANDSTDWGIIQLIDMEAWEGYIMISIDCEDHGWMGTARIQLIRDGQLVLDDSIQSGVRGPLGNPVKKKQYPIGNFRS